MAKGAGKKFGIGLAVVVIGLAVIIGYPAIFPKPAEPDIETLCKYISQSATSAQCTAAVAPEGFPVGNVVVVPVPPTPDVPLPVVLRSFVQTCWLDPEKASEVSKLLNRPPVDMTLPGFTADVSGKLTSGASITLAEADNLKIVAGSHSNALKSISVTPRSVQVMQMDQALVETLLHRPEIRQDCLERLLGPDRRLVVSVIVAKGLEYSVTSNDDAHLDLNAAIKTGFINVDGGPQISSNGRVVTNLSEPNPRVIGVVFADQMMIDDLQRLVRKGNVISSAGKSQVNVTSWFPEWKDKPEITASQKPDGTFSFDQASVDSIFQNLEPPRSATGNTPLAAMLIRPPNAAGSSGALPTDSTYNTNGDVSPASVKFDTRADLTPGVIEWQDIPKQDSIGAIGQYPAETWKSPVGFEETSEGSFRILKRLDGPETLVVHISRKKEPIASMPLGDIVVDMEDATHKRLLPALTRPLAKIDESGITFQKVIDQAGVYLVNVEQRASLWAESKTSIDSSLKVEVSFAPLVH